MDFIIDGHRAVAATGDVPFDDQKPALVFIHGAGMDRTVWALQARHPAFSNWNVFAVDLPGHGLSAGQPLSSIGGMACWILRLLDEVGAKRAALAGHSMGALVALEAAARARTRISSIALLGITFPMGVAPQLLEAAKANDHAAVEMIIGWAYAASNSMGGGPAPGLRMTGAGTRLLANARPGVLHADLAACNAYADGAQSAAAVTSPALFILGGKDKMARAKGAAGLAGAMSNAETVTISRSGHMLMSEASRDVIAALKAFLKAD